MSVDPGSIEHLSEIISHVVAPAFLLGAVASFVSILVGRTRELSERIRDIAGSGERTPADMPRLQHLKRRALLLHRSVLLSIASAALAALLIIVAFAAALLQIQHVWSAALLFMSSMGLLLAALVAFALEVRLGLIDDGHF